MPSHSPTGSSHPLVEQVVEHIRKAIEQHSLQPGDRLPPERELAAQLNISRATLRTGIGHLAAMGVLRIRTGVGTFVADGPPQIGTSSFQMMRILHGFQTSQMFETRIILESSLAALAAERGQEEDFADIADEVTEMYATWERAADFLIHDVLFHRAIARASRNPILAALMETIVGSLYEERRTALEQGVNLRESANTHRDIYRAIRARDAVRASELMRQHLVDAAAASPGTASPAKQAGSAPALLSELRKSAADRGQ